VTAEPHPPNIRRIPDPPLAPTEPSPVRERPGAGKTKVAILGAGHGGTAMAGHLALLGFEVTVCSLYGRELEAVEEKGGAELVGEEVSGFGKYARVERSIDKGTQWAVFEPNGEQLWGKARRTIEDFLLNEWQSGALLGDKPEKAFFVRCDRSTMTQNDLDNGRLICTIGIAPLKPAEFVIFRIGQWTADRKA